MFRHLSLLFLTVGLLLTTSVLSAQPALRDVVYLKNGSIIRGIVLEQIPDKTIRIQTADGSVFVYQMSEVERIVKEPITPAAPAAVPVAAPTTAPADVEQPQSSGFLSILAGGVVPTGEFAAKEGDGAGLANFGYALGVQYSNISAGGMYFAIGAVFSGNPLDESGVRNLVGVPSDASIDVQPWKSISPTISLGFGSSTPGFRAFIASQIGAAFSTSPEMTISAGGITVKQEASNATALCYGGILGFQTAGKFSLSVRYLISKPKYKFNVTAPGYSMTSEVEQRTGLLQIMAGIGL
jgi:hypothetical protein